VAATGRVGTPRRRTQAQRRAATRAALLDATIECVVEDGYAGTTTTRVVERAGMSRGAQVHHFPTKAQLVAEAVRHLTRRRAAELLGEVDRLPPRGRRRVETVLDLLWRSHSGPLFAASVEMFVAARTDADLRAELREVESEITAAVGAALEDVFGEVARQRAFRELVETSLASMRGLALLAFYDGDRDVERRWRAVRSRLLDMYTHTVEEAG
jgi:AcrR family transcriptional regulator